MEATDFSFELELREGYSFTIRLDQPDGVEISTDEPPPLGSGAGPNAARLLAAAVGNCLAASLLFCLRKARIQVSDLRATIHGSIHRNEHGRFRIGRIQVQLEPTVAHGERDRINRCREIFEDFCIVTQSVRHGVDVDVNVVVSTAQEVAQC